jgi:hypothetical protein
MSERVDARDVMDANATTKRAFRASVLGHFRRTGPNSWDDYEFVRAEPGEAFDVAPGVRVQLERQGPVLRLRSMGRVLRVRWLPAEGGSASDSEQRDSLLRDYVESQSEAPGIGEAAFIASKLGGS